VLKFQNGNRDNDAITDSMAASAYVEEFGLEVFGRAEAALRANKVTKFVRTHLRAEYRVD
jgi:vacuolar protein sorting-associated protein VTA1